METKPPFIYDSLDRPNVNQQSGEKIKYRSDWRVVAVVCFTLLLVAGLFIALHQYAWYLITATQYVELGQILIASIYVAMIGALFITIIISKVQK